MITMTKKELSTLAGYTYRRLYDIDRSLPDGKKLFVPTPDGRCDAAAFVQNWVDYNIAGTAKNDSASLEEIKARHETIKAEKTRLEVERMRGQLIDVQDVRKLWADIANTVMQNLIRLPSKIAPRLQMQSSVEMIADILDRDIRRILEEIADTPLPDYATTEEDKED